MSSDPVPSANQPTTASIAVASEDTLLLLNRAMLVMHSVRGAAHELNNVLQMISGSAELLELNPECPASMTPKLQAIGTHTGRGYDLVSVVAEMARAQPQRGNLTDVGKTVERVRQLRRFEQARAGVDLKVDLPPGPLLVRADPLDVQLMLLNLVINAEQAIAVADSKVISVRGVVDGGACRLSITDTGRGHAPAAPFVSTGPPSSAAGLGLAATDTLAKRNGGDLVVRESESGVVAELTLPIART